MKKANIQKLVTTLTPCLLASLLFVGCDKESTIRVGSYNIEHGVASNLDMSIIAADILGNDLDIVGLQEIDQNTKRVNGMDTMKTLSEMTGYKHYAFTRAIDFQGGEYGTAILSRYPIDSFEVIPLDSGKHEQRSLGHAVVNIHGKKLNFFNTHLSFEDLETRTKQFKTLADETAKCKTFILTADFNTADTNEFSVISNATLANPNKYPTFPSSQEAIDNVVYSSDFELVDAGMGPEGHSDHNMLWTELSWKPAKK